MKHLVLISTCILASCQPKPVVETIPIVDKPPSKSQPNESMPEANIDVIAEAKVTALLDLIKANKMSLIKECPIREGRVGLDSGHINVGKMNCEIDGIKVFMGSAEIEFKLKHCQENGKPEDEKFYVFGAISENEFQLINSKEEKQPLYVCAK